MTGENSFFPHNDNIKDRLVTFGDRREATIYGKGSVSAPGILELKDVLFMNGIKANLIIISEICDDKWLVKFTHKKCIMYNNFGSVVIKGIQFEDNRYCIDDFPSRLCNKANHWVMSTISYKENLKS